MIFAVYISTRGHPNRGGNNLRALFVDRSISGLLLAAAKPDGRGILKLMKLSTNLYMMSPQKMQQVRKAALTSAMPSALLVRSGSCFDAPGECLAALGSLQQWGRSSPVLQDLVSAALPPFLLVGPLASRLLHSSWRFGCPSGAVFRST